MWHGQKNRLFGLSQRKFAVARHGIGAVVEREEGLRTARLYLEADAARVGYDHGAHREVVRCDGGNDKAGAGGGYDRTAGAERVGGRTGGGRDNHAVTVAGGDHLFIDIEFDGEHAGTVALHGELVECQRTVAVCREVAAYLDQRALLEAQLPVVEGGKDALEPLARVGGEESQVAGIDAHHGQLLLAEAMYPLEQRAVTTVADQHGRLGLVPDRCTVLSLRGNRPTDFLLKNFGKLLIYSAVESKFGDRFPQEFQLLGLKSEPSAGKKYDFHPSVTKK